MIVTVTPNPSVDRTLSIATLDRGSVIRSLGHAQVDPGGKGINVVRTLTAAGVDALAVIPVGGDEGQRLVHLLQQRGINPVTVPIVGHVRGNIALAEPDGTVTKINESGPDLLPLEVDALLRAAADSVDEMSWLVGCGSLPPGVGGSFWARLIAHGRAAGARTAIDTSGTSLLAAVTAGPDLVKPNLLELADVVESALPTLGHAMAAAEDLHRRGATAVLASLGEDGAILVGDGIKLYGEADRVPTISAVGAGDALLAGYLSEVTGDDTDPAMALRMAVAHGTAAVQLSGSSLPTPADLRPDAVIMHHDPDPARILRSWAPPPHAARMSRSQGKTMEASRG